MKIVVNGCFGGFGFSNRFLAKYPTFNVWNTDRDNPNLIQALEDFGLEEASDSFAQLRIVEIPDEATDYEISDYDGAEEVIYVVDGKLYHA